MFNLPITVDGGANNDPDLSVRTPPKGEAGTNDGVGSLQEDALQIHQHQYNKVPETSTLIQPEKDDPAIAPLPQPALTGAPTNLENTVRTSSTETRPKNVYVHYIIKYTNC